MLFEKCVTNMAEKRTYKTHSTYYQIMENKEKILNDDFQYNQQEEEACTLIPILKLIPAKEILSKDHKKDEEVKIVMKVKVNEYQPDKNSRDKDGGRFHEFSQVFEEQDCLGYEYQSLFQKKMVYSRLMGSANFDKWIEMINYYETDGTNRQYGRPNEENKNKRSLRYIAGLFIRPKNITIKASNNEIQNNFYHFADSNQINTNPNRIMFIANYQSANLLYAFQMRPFEYDLILHNDTNSKGSTQWFNFTVIFPDASQISTPTLFKFNIVNMTKSSSIFTKGMKIVCKSNIDGKWKRLATDCTYNASKVSIEGREDIKYRILSFEYLCQPKADDRVKVVFSYSYPYTGYSNEKFWQRMAENVGFNKLIKNSDKMIMNRKSIGNTLSGLPIEVIQVSDKKLQKNLQNNDCKSIVFMGRQHPGQTQGSFIIEGIVEWLLNCPSSFMIKKKLVFHFIPLVNAEGVLMGNYRTNISGYDLNRNWRNPTKNAQPQIVYIKNYLQKINQENPISLIVDLHGHSKSFNSFFYGAGKGRGKDNSKLFPYYCSKKLKQISYSQCNFTISENKKNTARAVLSQLFPKAFVYTLQNSFYGYQSSPNKITEYNPENLRRLGRDLIKTYFQFVFMNISANAKSQELNKLEKQIEVFEKSAVKENEQMKQSLDSDSQAQQQLINFQMPKRKVQFMNFNEQKSREKSKSKIVVISCNPRSSRGKNYEQNAVKSGSYLKTIEMIENSRSERQDEDYLFKYDSENFKVKNNKYVKSPSLPTKQNVQLKTQQKAPLFSVSSIKPEININKSTFRASTTARFYNRPKPLQTLKFINEKQIAMEQIRLRRMKGQGIESDLVKGILKTSMLAIEKNK